MFCTLNLAYGDLFHWNAFLCLTYLPDKLLLQAVCYIYDDILPPALAGKYQLSFLLHRGKCSEVAYLQVSLHNTLDFLYKSNI